MRKLISTLMALTMLLFSFAAMAETTVEAITLEDPSQTFDVKVALPEGLTKGEVVLQDDFSMVDMVYPNNEEACEYVLVIVPSEEYAGRNMADLTEEEKSSILEMMVADSDEAVYGIVTLPSGEEMLYYVEGGTAEIGNILDLHNGYFIQLTYLHADSSAILESDTDAAETLMDAITYEEVK